MFNKVLYIIQRKINGKYQNIDFMLRDYKIDYKGIYFMCFFVILVIKLVYLIDIEFRKIIEISKLYFK